MIPNLTVLGLKSDKNRFFVPHYKMLPKLYKKTRMFLIESRSVMRPSEAVQNLDYWNLDSDIFYTEDSIGYDTLMSTGNGFSYFKDFLRVYRIAHGLFEQDNLLRGEWNANKNHVVDIYKNLLISDIVLVSPVLEEMFDRVLPDYFSKKILKTIKAKFFVAPPPDLYKLDIPNQQPKKKFKELVFLWNHRFVASKNYEDYFNSISRALELEPSLRIRILILSPNNETEIKKCVPKNLHQFLDIRGFLTDPADYQKAVSEANISLATSKIESFGISVFDSMSQGLLVLNLEANQALASLSPKGMTFSAKDLPKVMVKVSKSQTYRNDLLRMNWEALTGLMPIDDYRKKFKTRLVNLVNERLDRVSDRSKNLPKLLKATEKTCTKQDLYSAIDWKVSNTCQTMYWGPTYYALRKNGVQVTVKDGVVYYHQNEFKPQTSKSKKGGLFK